MVKLNLVARNDQSPNIFHNLTGAIRPRIIMLANFDINGFDNEDVSRQYTLKSGNADSSVPFDLTSVDFEMDVRDQKNVLVIRLTSADGGGILITDAPNGVFTIHIAQGAIPNQANRSMRYDLLMRVNGELRRLWGGNVRISQGVTVP